MTQAPDLALYERIRQQLDVAREAGHDPLVVLDLDGTLYDNTHRTLRIIQEFAHTHAARYPELYRAVNGLAPGQMRYKVADTLGAIGIVDQALVDELVAAWLERFFTDAYCLYDLPVGGAVEFVTALHDAGAVPAYLTGRDAPNMLQGTIATLQRDGFPVGRVDTRIILKEAFERADEDYKRAVVAHLRKTGHVVAVFDNEPGLCNLFKEAFPAAVVVWLDTSHAPGAPALRDDVLVISDFIGLAPTAGGA